MAVKNRTKKREARSDFSRTGLHEVATIILGGGEGKRLQPLTLNRCKPAVPFGGNFCLIDIPICHSISAGCYKTFVITQFLSSSLNHHISQTYQQLKQPGGALEILTAEQRPSGQNWFQGTADAVRQNLHYILSCDAPYFLILAGDQLYDFDFTPMFRMAVERDADVVIAALPVEANDASKLGILKVDEESAIIDFIEKPSDLTLLDQLRTKASLLAKAGFKKNGQKHYLGSMGIYLFKRSTLIHLLLEDPREDFGKHLIPTQIGRGKTYAYLYNGYWEDIGAVKAFYEANLALTDEAPPFDLRLHATHLPVSSHVLPPTKIRKTVLDRTLLCEGSTIAAESITHSVIGPRSTIGEGTRIEDSYLMGNDYYTTRVQDLPQMPATPSIGRDCVIKQAIIDRNVVIGDGVQLINKKRAREFQNEYLSVREGIIVVPQGTHIPNHYRF